MNNKLRCFSTLLVVAMPLALFAQTGTVAGRVMDQDGNGCIDFAEFMTLMQGRH